MCLVSGKLFFTVANIKVYETIRFGGGVAVYFLLLCVF